MNIDKNRILIENLLLEGRLEDVKAKYPGNDEVIDRLSSIDPSGNNKYLSWLTYMNIDNNVHVNKLTDAITYFHSNLHKFEQKDINQYRTWSEFVEARTKSETKQSRKEIKDSGADKIFENDDYLVVRPKNHQASCKYGSNTRWCITMRNYSNYWDNYSKNSPFFFVIDKKRLPNEKGLPRKVYYKVAIQVHVPGSSLKVGTMSKEQFVNDPLNSLYFTYWNSSDTNVTETTVKKYFGQDNHSQIIDAIKGSIKSIYSTFYDKTIGTLGVDITNEIDRLKSEYTELKEKIKQLDESKKEEWFIIMDKLNNFLDEYEKTAKQLGSTILDRSDVLNSLNLYSEYNDNIDRYVEINREYDEITDKLTTINGEIYDKSVELGNSRKNLTNKQITFNQ